MSNVDLKKLSKKFPEEDLEWRIQQCGNNSWALVVPYITSRAVMKRLDDACGLGGWRNEEPRISPCGKGYISGLSIKIDGEWVSRWDGAEIVGNVNIDQVKSTLSSVIKRCGVLWGIGQYLYQLEVAFADVKPCDSRRDLLPGYTYHENKKKQEKFQWKPPAIEAWALPLSDKDISLYLKTLKEVTNLDELRFAWQQVYKVAVSEGDDEVMEKFTKAKDEAKERIAREQQEQLNGDEAKLSGWIAKQVASFSMVPNEASVTSLRDSLLRELKKKTKNTAVNSDPFKEKIETAYNQRISEF